MPDIQLDQIPAAVWNELPRDIQGLLTDLEFRGRIKGGMQKGLRRMVRDDLDDGQVVNMRQVAEKEVAKLIMKKAISPAQHKRAIAYVVRQLTGAVAAARDSSGLRLYYCIGSRHYVAREHAPPCAWVNEARRMIKERKRWFEATGRLLELIAQRFGNELPDDLNEEIDASKTVGRRATSSLH